MALFHAKTGQDRPKKRENFSSFGIDFTQPELENFKKNSKKIQTIKKHQPHFISN